MMTPQCMVFTPLITISNDLTIPGSSVSANFDFKDTTSTLKVTGTSVPECTTVKLSMQVQPAYFVDANLDYTEPDFATVLFSSSCPATVNALDFKVKGIADKSVNIFVHHPQPSGSKFFPFVDKHNSLHKK